MYVAVKDGEKAISATHGLLRREGRGGPSVPDLGVDQLTERLRLAVDRVMVEGSLYDRDLAALAIKQAQGNLLEAVFLVRVYRTTLPQFGSSLAVDTSAIHALWRISATWKDPPGGQILGTTFDYTYRLLDRILFRAEAGVTGSSPLPVEPNTDFPLGGPLPRALGTLVTEGSFERPEPSEGGVCRDTTRYPLGLPADTPADRGVRLQALTCTDGGSLLGITYFTQRGFDAVHPFTGELRREWVEVSFFSEELGFDVAISETGLAECEIVSRYTGAVRSPCSTQGYGLVFGNNERKAPSISITDRALRAKELDEPVVDPVQSPEFVLLHDDNVDASGFIRRIKLPHYVDSQADLSLIHGLCAKRQNDRDIQILQTDVYADAPLEGYAFAYLDETVKRMIRRGLLKAAVIPGYQVPFVSRGMPIPCGWGTGGIQITASILSRDDILKVIDQGFNDTTNAVSIRDFFRKTTGVVTTAHTDEAIVTQTRHRTPERPLTEPQIMAYQVPLPEPLRWLEPSGQEAHTLHALEEYGIMNVKLYEDIVHHGAIATGFDYLVRVTGRYIVSPSPIPRFDNPKVHQCPALRLFGAGHEKRLYTIPSYTDVESLDLEDYPFTVQSWDETCTICGSTDTYLDEVILDDRGNRMFVCSDIDCCAHRVTEWDGQGGTQ